MNIDWSLIRRSIVSRLPADEQHILDKWLEESPGHVELYRNIRTFLSDTESFRPDEERTRHFRMIYEQRLTVAARRRRLHRIYKNIRIAALFALPVGIALFFLLSESRQVEIPAGQASVVVVPGSRKAILETGSGKIVRLDATQAVIEAGKGVMVKNDTNLLVYSDVPVGEEEMENRLMVPRGGEYSIQLGDGTKIWLNSASELKYPVCFNGPIRKVYLKGEAYFQVAKNPEKPFIVQTDDIEVKVYGTEFNINTRSEAGVQTTLVNGSVSVRNASGPEQQLKPEQMAEYNRETGGFVVKEVVVENYIGWKSGVYIFENRSIGQIMEELSLWYDVEVLYRNNESRNERFSGRLPRYRDIRDMLSMLEKTSHIHFEIEKDTIIVK